MYRYALILCTVVMALGADTASAQTYTGTVTDSVSSAALESVTVSLQGSGVTGLTDASGAFTLETSGIGVSGAVPGKDTPLRFDMERRRVSWHGLPGASFSLYDIRGRRLMRARRDRASGSLGLPAGLVNGVYVLEAVAAGTTHRLKFMVAPGASSAAADAASTARTAVAADGDTLSFSKAGYVYKRAAAGTGMVVVLTPLGQAAATRQSSVTWRDVTFTFDASMPVGFFCNGDPFVVADQAFGITSISPDAEVINGYMANGSMMNVTSENMQGFDGIPADNSAAGQSAATCPYVDSLNVDPAAAGHALSFASGGSGSVVKSVRVDGVTTPGPWQVIDRYVVLTVLPAAPPEGSFRPPVSGTDKSVIGTETDLRWQVLRSGPDFAGQNHPDSVIGYLKPTLPLWGQSGESLRRINVEGGNNYSRDFGMRRATALTALHGTAAQAEKRDLFVRAVQHGIDVYGTCREGWAGAAGAGQHHGYHPFLWYAAFALESPAMVVAAQRLASNMVTQHFWVADKDIGYGVRWPDYNQHTTLHQTHFDEHLGMPDWITDATDADHAWDRGRNNSRQTCSYKPVALAAFFPELTSVIMLRNGPGGVTGDAAVVNGPFDASNYYAAPLAYLDRTAAWAPMSGTNSIHDNHRAAYEAFRDLVSTPRWTGRPDLVRSEWDELELIAADGGFDYTYPTDISTLPVTRTDLRYSTDHRSWVTLEDVPLSGSVTGLAPGVLHIVQMRQVNAAGAGAWSMNYPKAWDIFANGPVPHTKATVTPAGTASAAAPDTLRSPVLCYQKYPRWGGIYFEPVGDTLPDGVLRLFCGDGYWTGSPSFTYQWLRDGSDITGATEDAYTLAADDLDALVSCRVTATGAGGTATAVTNAVRFVYDDGLDSNVVFESDFTDDIRADVADFIASCIAGDAPAANRAMDAVWQPYELYDGAATAGAVYGDKTGSRPFFAGVIPVPAWAKGRQVRARAHYDVRYRSGTNALGFGFYRATASELQDAYADDNLETTPPTDADGFNFDETFTLDTDYIVVRMSIGTATGGTSGGDPYFTYLRVETVD